MFVLFSALQVLKGKQSCEEKKRLKRETKGKMESTNSVKRKLKDSSVRSATDYI